MISDPSIHLKRRVIQISTLSPLRIPQNQNQTPRIYALCNDGTMWMHAEDLGWRQLPDIPQDEK
jgi:hypothetical protein